MGTLDRWVGRLEDAIGQRALAVVRRPGFPTTATEAEQHCVATVAYARLDRSGRRRTPMTQAAFDTYLGQSDGETRALTVGWLKVESARRRRCPQVGSVQ